MFGRIYSSQGRRLAVDFRFVYREADDDRAFSQFCATKICESVIVQAAKAEVLYKMISPELSNEELVRNRR